MKTLTKWLLLLFISSNSFAHVKLDNPVGGEKYDPNEIVIIKWHILISHPQNNWDLYFSEDGGVTWQDLGIDLPVSQLTFTWTVPDIMTSHAKIKIVMDNVVDNYESISEEFSIGVFNPLILDYPMGNENFTVGTTENISWEVNGFVSFDNWSLLYSVDNGTTWETIESNIDADTLSYDWQVPDMPTSQAKIKLQMNIAGVVYEDESGIFTINKNLVTGIEPNRINPRFKIYPNPSSKNVFVQLDDVSNQPIKITIYNQFGQSILTKANNNGLLTVDWSQVNVSPGVYFYRLQAGSDIATGKLLYQNQ